MANNLDTQEVTQNTAGNYVQHNTGHAQAIAGLTGLAALTVTTANVDLTTGDKQDVNSQVYKALRNLVFVCTGTLTGNRQVIVPTNKKLYIVSHQCAGGFTITVKTSGGSGIALSNGHFKVLYCDGTNVVEVTGSGVGGDTLHTSGAGAPSAGSVAAVGHLYTDTTNNRLYFGVTVGGNFIDVGTLGIAFNQITDGTNASNATAAQKTFRFAASSNILPAINLGTDPDQATWLIAVSGETAEDLLLFRGGVWTRLAKGTDGQVLKMVSGLVTWAAP